MQTLHGDQLQDDYFWLRERENPEVKAYLENENAYTDAFMKPTEALQKTLYDEMLGRIKETDLSVPYRERGWFYYSRTEKGKQYPIYCRKKGSLEAPEEVYLDVNELAKGERFMNVAVRAFSDDGHLLAYTTDNTGFRDYTLHVKDMSDGQAALREGRARDVGRLGARQQDALLRDDGPGQAPVPALPARARHRYRRRRAALRGEGRALPGRRRAARAAASTSSSPWSATRARSGATFRPSTPAGEPRLISPREDEHEYSVDHRGDLFYIRTNDKGRNNRLVTAPIADPRHENWKEIVPHRDDVMLEDFDLFANWTVLYERAGRACRASASPTPRRGNGYRIEFPEAIYSASPENNREFDTQTLRYRVRVLHDAALGLRLRHGDQGAQAPEAAGGARRLRPVALHLRAALRDGLRRHEGPDLAGLQEGLRRRRQGARCS